MPQINRDDDGPLQARELGDETLQAMVGLAQGGSHYIQGQFKVARPLLEALLPLAERTGNSLLVARTVNILGRLMVFDALGMTWRTLRVRPDPRRTPVTGLTDYEAFCGIRGEESEVDLTGVPTLSVEELRARREAGEAFDLIDIREAHEAEIARIPGARLFPLSELPARLHELDSARTYTLSCHRGVRSLQAYELLRRAGFGRLRVLAGGVDAWAERIDPTMARY